MTPTIQELCQIMGDIRRTLRSGAEIETGPEFRECLAQVLEDVEGYLVTTEEALARWQTLAFRPSRIHVDKPTSQP